MPTRMHRFLIGLVIITYVLVLLACILPGQDGAAGGKPTVNIVSPAAGAQVVLSETVTVQVVAVDAQGVARVELQMDNTLVTTQDLPQPATVYQGTLTWVATTPGPHALLVRAYNTAGTVSDPTIVSVLVLPTGSATTVAQSPATMLPATVIPPPPSPVSGTIVPLSATPMPTYGTTVPPSTQPTSRPTVKPTPKPTRRPTVPALAGKIAFPVLNDDKRHYDIWIVNADGSNARCLLKRMRQPCFRPDGGMLVVNGEAPNQAHLIIMNADGSKQRPASKHVEDSHPSWSPDGRRLIYDTTAAPGGGWQICVIDNPDERSWRALPDPGGSIMGLRGRYPTWMPDGRIIFRTSNYWGDNTQAGLYISGGGVSIPDWITSSGQDTAPAVHGGTVAFMSIRQPDDYEIFTSNIYGLDANLKQLTDNDAQDGLPTWSPDGQHIAFVSDEGGAWGLWVINADGSGRYKLLDLPGTLGGDWSTERISWAP